MTKRAATILALLGSLLVACAGVDPLPAELHVPLPPVAAPDPAGPARGVWRVAPFAAAGPYRERAMVYSEDDGATLRQHPHQFWLDSPAALWRDALIVGLREAALGTRVVAAADAGARYEVRGRVLAFDRLVSGTASTARLALELEVIDTGTREVRLSRRYEARQPAVDNDARGMAAAAAMALATINRRFVTDVREALTAP